MDQIAMGWDCWRHPVAGTIISNNGTPPAEQVRNHLRSLFDAGQINKDELHDLAKQLAAWERAQ
jgi:hypothetical protein